MDAPASAHISARFAPMGPFRFRIHRLSRSSSQIRVYLPLDGTDPRPAKVYHAYSNASGAVSIDGSIAAGDVGTRLPSIKRLTNTQSRPATPCRPCSNAFVNLINSDPECGGHRHPRQCVSPAFILQANIAGPDSNGISLFRFRHHGDRSDSERAFPLTLCCANQLRMLAGHHRITLPIPGEIRLPVLATGLGATTAGTDSGKVARHHQRIERRR